MTQSEGLTGQREPHLVYLLSIKGAGLPVSSLTGRISEYLRLFGDEQGTGFIWKWMG